VKRSNRLVILVGLLLAVLAFVAIIIVLNGKGGGNGAKPLTVDVLVAKSDIAIGTPVTPDLVDVQAVNPDAVVATRIAAPSLLTGRPALFAIVKGQQVTAEAAGISTTTSNINIEGQLQPGEKAIAFQVDRVTGLDFLLQPGDHIDIVLAQDVQPVQETQDSVTARVSNSKLQPRYELVNGLNNVRTVKTILQDRRVLYVSATRIRNQQTGTASPTPGQGGQQTAAQFEVVIIVFAGTDQDAELIKFAQNNLGEQGALTAILRDTQDPDNKVTTTGITLDRLIKQYGVPLPNLVVLPPQSPAP
jgi:Flp pilus assembly protein CpaB